ncbi:MAG: family efflux transporter subunit, HlyD family secretion protein [Parcubacteria group bacterium]|nr:family efflux transporter subunit, HlyD family secretion protein [Parcubacteria group bacterium]
MLQRLLARIGSFFKGVFAYGMRHKVQAAVFLLILAGLAYGGYTTYAKSVTTTQYVLARASIAPIEQTVTGSGQVASEHQLNLSPKASGTLTSVTVKAGDQVTAGQIIATVDSTDAQKTVRDAASSLASARISYLQSQTSDTNTVQKSSDAVFSTSATAYSDLSTVLAGLNSIMQGNEVSGSYVTKNIYAYSKLFNDNPSLTVYRDRAIASYTAAVSAYQSSFAAYNGTSRSSDPAAVEALAQKTYAATQAGAQAAKDLNDYLNAVKQRFSLNDPNQPSILPAHISSSLSYLNTMNADVNATFGAQNDLASSIQSSGSGTVTLSQESAQLSYQKAQNAYQDARSALDNYVVRAPFAGTIASVPLQKFDQAGGSATVAVLVTKQQLATLSLNEVDAAKVKGGQKVTLTFDAIDGLTINGTVAEVDTVGSVTQGVVSYTVKIAFDSQDTRILPGMTVNATIVTASKDQALVIPSSAIKTQGTQTYVEVASYTAAGASSTASSTRAGGASAGQFRRASTTGAFASSTGAGGFASRAGGTGAGPTVDAASVTVKRVNIATGIVSDTMTEVTSGLTPGEFVVSSSLNASGKATAGTKSIFSLFGSPGGTRTGGTGAGAARTTTGATRTGGGNTGVAGRAGG